MLERYPRMKHLIEPGPNRTKRNCKLIALKLFPTRNLDPNVIEKHLLPHLCYPDNQMLVIAVGGRPSLDPRPFRYYTCDSDNDDSMVFSRPAVIQTLCLCIRGLKINGKWFRQIVGSMVKFKFSFSDIRYLHQKAGTNRSLPVSALRITKDDEERAYFLANISNGYRQQALEIAIQCGFLTTVQALCYDGGPAIVLERHFEMACEFRQAEIYKALAAIQPHYRHRLAENILADYLYVRRPVSDKELEDLRWLTEVEGKIKQTHYSLDKFYASFKIAEFSLSTCQSDMVAHTIILKFIHDYRFDSKIRTEFIKTLKFMIQSQIRVRDSYWSAIFQEFSSQRFNVDLEHAKEIIDLFLKLGCPQTSNLASYLVKSDKVELLEYIKGKGFTCNPELLRVFMTPQSSPELITWVEQLELEKKT